MNKKYSEPAIEVEGLRKVYRHLVAVDNVSFVMYQGEAFGFLGPNGAGKSTVVSSSIHISLPMWRHCVTVLQSSIRDVS